MKTKLIRISQFPLFLIAGIIVLGITSATAYAQPGSLDNTFGSGGIVTTPIGPTDDYGNSMAIQSDGKIVVAGTSGNGFAVYFSVLRYNTDGSLDNTFGSGGIVNTDFGISVNSALAIGIQNDGKIVAVGSSYDGVQSDVAVVRYNTNGSLDNTFGTGGIVVSDFGGTSTEFGQTLAFQNDDKIIVGIQTDVLSNLDFGVARYNTNGNLDNTFGAAGFASVDFFGSQDFCQSVAIQTDGKILLGGGCVNGSNFDHALARYNSNGTLDNTFSSDGKVNSDIGSNDNGANSLAIQSDGKIIAGGFYFDGVDGNFAMIRYNVNGSIDLSFGLGGIAVTHFLGGEDAANSIDIASDGKIVMAGLVGAFPNYDIGVARYHSNGNLDNSFDADGKVTTAIGATYDGCRSMAIQNDGKIVVAGISNNGTDMDFAVARYIGCVNASNTINQTACFSYTLNSQTYTGSGTYYQTINIPSGCDSIITLNLTINSVNTSVTRTGATLTANATGSTYQWIDCDNGNSIVPGATNQSYTGTSNGNFAVIVTSNGCTDTSACQNNTFGISENSLAISSTIYPNPFSQSTTLEIKDYSLPFLDVQLKIYDALGREMYNQNLGSNISILNPILPKGIYFYKIFKGEKEVIGGSGKLIIQ